MKTRNKVLTLSLSAVLLVAASVLGTMAYLTSTQSVMNTFTVGKVGITLDERDTDDSTADTERDQANIYKLIPGSEYVKDPTIHMNEDSEDAYLFVTVANGIEDIEAETGTMKADGHTLYKTIADQMEELGWKKATDTENTTYYYKENAVKAEDGKNVEVFSEFMISGEVLGGSKNDTGADLSKKYIGDYSDAEIVVNAYAIQKENFVTAEAAWNAVMVGNN